MEHRRIIKRGPIVLATKEDGTMDPASVSSQGLFLADTRFLSSFGFLLNDLPPVLMGSSEEILFQTAYLFTNPMLSDIPARGLGIMQHNTIEEDSVKIEITIANWSLKPLRFHLAVFVDADFYDSFEARGVKRMKRGQILEPRITDTSVDLGYEGLDRVRRCTHIEVSPGMERFADKHMYFPLQIDDLERKKVELNIRMREEAAKGVHVIARPELVKDPKPPWFDQSTRITTSNGPINGIVRRSIDDLEALMLRFRDGWVPAAGLPRFAVPFGRDSLVTSLETLVWNPELSRSVLRFLAHTQGKEENPWNYEQPGKIIHEMHTGELANLRETPFGLFYGSVDATPLFLVLGAEYIRWTGDMELYRELKPNFEAAWKWVDDYGDIDGSGYVQYQAHTPPKAASAALTVGLFNQGWKDSATSVMYANGQMVTDHPVSLAEVQGELYRALRLWSELYASMPASEGMAGKAAELAARAGKLREQFNREFWMPEKSYFAMALDGHHRQVDSITSNPAECLWARLLDDDEKAEKMVATMMSPAMFTSWGIRTMANTEKAYNAFSYHDGSIWPFENAIIMSGLKKYGFIDETQQVLDAMVEAAWYFEYLRWPEVYAGVSREIGGVLARQPDASRPQAWSSGAIFLILQTILGIATKPLARRVDVTPALPSCLTEATFENISICGELLSLRLVKEGSSLLMEIKDNPGDLDVVVHPPTRGHTHVTAGDMAVSG